ncbi:MAG: regulatory iron-sulfur-containing complex subunit RicT [Candidatus Gracilibacteria bacterium]
MPKKNLAHGISSFFHYKTVYVPALEGDDYVKGDTVVFSDDEDKNEIGEVIVANADVAKDDLSPTSEILRKATQNDIQKMNANKELAAEAYALCKELIARYELNMALIDCVISLDGIRMNFIFTSEDRVDFRDLVKELAKKFQKQIHLQQIGPRDKARFLRGYGKCGRKLCCEQTIGKLKSITMDMVRVQGMSNKGSDKLSGVCGKLMCCLAHEVADYDELRKNIPPFLSLVYLKDGKSGVLRGMDILNQKMRLDGEKETFMANVADIKKFTPPKGENPSLM